MTRNEASELIRRWQGEGLRVGFTSGVFDILHAGHLDYLSKAREHCDRLLVAVNSDISVRRIKGPSRPVVPEDQRAALVAGLRAVDAVFLFDEPNNNENIRTLRPDLYIKAGDYDMSRLSSAPLVESYGGRVVLIPVSHKTSTSEILENAVVKTLCRAAPAPARTPRPVIFLDRDGVINEDTEFLHDPDKFRMLPGAVEGILAFFRAGYALVVVTNQAGIGMGYYRHEDFYKVNRVMLKSLHAAGVALDRIYYCPHSAAENCLCRKPKTGMLKRAFEEMALVKEGSWMIGDRDVDMETGADFGVRTLLITGGICPGTKGELKAANLAEAARLILGAAG